MALGTFNGQRFVEAQLASILSQTRVPDEVIISDDASTDDTLNRVACIATKHPKVIQIIQNGHNRGYLENFECAVRRTTGDVIFLSDQDDVWFPDKIATMVEVFVENPEVVLAYSDAQLTDAELRPTGHTMFEQRKSIDLGTRQTVRQLGRAVGFNGPTVAFHSRLKPYILPFSPLSKQWGHDHWMGFIAYAVGETRAVNRPLVYYRRHGNNTGGDAELDGGLWHQWQVVKKIYGGSFEYGERRRGWEDMVARLYEIKNNHLPLDKPAKLDELLHEAELCLRFAQTREKIKKKKRWARPFLALPLLMAGEYQRHARGVKSLIQDVAIP